MKQNAFCTHSKMWPRRDSRAQSLDGSSLGMARARQRPPYSIDTQKATVSPRDLVLKDIVKNAGYPARPAGADSIIDRFEARITNVARSMGAVP